MFWGFRCPLSLAVSLTPKILVTRREWGTHMAGAGGGGYCRNIFFDSFTFENYGPKGDFVARKLKVGLSYLKQIFSSRFKGTPKGKPSFFWGNRKTREPPGRKTAPWPALSSRQVLLKVLAEPTAFHSPARYWRLAARGPWALGPWGLGGLVARAAAFELQPEKKSPYKESAFSQEHAKRIKSRTAGYNMQTAKPGCLLGALVHGRAIPSRAERPWQNTHEKVP